MTYYEILGLSENASQEEIKVAYRKRALEYHPDVNKSENAGKIFLLINNAYKVLSNPTTKGAYDERLKNHRIVDRLKKAMEEKDSSARENGGGQGNNTSQQAYNKRTEEDVAGDINQASGYLVVIIVFIVLAIVFYKDCSTSSRKTAPIIENSTPANNEMPKESELGKLNEIESLRRREESEMLNKALSPEVGQNIRSGLKKYDSNNSVGQGSSGVQKPKTNTHYNNRLKTGQRPYDTFFGKGVFDQSSLCEVTIKNGNSEDVVVVFQNVSSRRVVRNVYIRAGDNYTVAKLPIGTYEMKCCFGNGWDPDFRSGDNGPVGGFLLNVHYSAAGSSKDYFRMTKEETRSGYDYSVYTVTLYKVRDGNMGERAISGSAFFECK